MSDDLQKNTKTRSDCGCGDSGISGDKTVDTSRRRFAAASMAAPIIATLVSRPVWGSSCSPTGFHSGNLSDNKDDECRGNGCTPGFWKTHPDLWPNESPACGIFASGMCKTFNNGGQCTEWNSSGGTAWQTVFSFPAAIQGIYDNGGLQVTLLEVMLHHNLAGNRGTYENHVVAALLNACFAPDTYGATVQEVIDIVEMVELPQGPQNPLGKTWEDAFALFAGMNEAGNCFFDAHGNCEQQFVLMDGQCIPACPDGYYYDPEALACVQGEASEDTANASTDPTYTTDPTSSSPPPGQQKPKKNKNK